MYIIRGLAFLAYSNFMIKDKSYYYFCIMNAISLENRQFTYDKEQLY